MTNRMLSCVLVFLFSVSLSFAGYLDGIKTDTSASFAITNNFVTEIITNNLGRADATNSFIKTLLEDPSPQLAADLDANGNEITDAGGRLNLDGSLFVTNGNVGIGTDSPDSPLEISSTSSSMKQTRWSDSAGSGAGIVIQRSRGAFVNSNTVVVSGDNLASINFRGYDGTDFITAAMIQSLVDGTPGTNDMPGRLIFLTTADGASSATERMRIDSSGNVGIGTNTPVANLHVEGTFQVEGVATFNGAVDITNNFLKSLIEDLGPQLAANLDAQGNRITGMADATSTNDAVTLKQARDLTNGVAASAVDSMGLSSTNIIVLVNRNGVNQLITNAVNTLIDYTDAVRNDNASFNLTTSIGTFPVNGFYYLKNVVSIDADNGIQVTTIIRTNDVQAMISRLNPGAVSPPTTIVDMYGSFTTNDTFSFRILHASSGNQNYRGGLNESYGYMELIHTE